MSVTKCLRLAVKAFATVAFAIVGCGPGSTRPTPTASPSSGPDATTPVPATNTAPVKTTPDVKLTAEEFYKESKKDGNYLISKHAGKLVELTGVVSKGLLDFGGDPLLLLIGGGEFDKVNCPVADRNHWSKAYPGQTVTLWGTSPTSAADPIPFVWHIKSATGPEPTKLTADDFVKEVVKDPEAAKKKYKGKHILLTGDVAEPKMYDNKLAGFSLKLKEKEPVIVCYVYGVGGDKETAFVKGVAKPGQKVTVLVEFEGYDAGEISMRGSILDPVY